MFCTLYRPVRTGRLTLPEQHFVFLPSHNAIKLTFAEAQLCPAGDNQKGWSFLVNDMKTLLLVRVSFRSISLSRVLKLKHSNFRFCKSYHEPNCGHYALILPKSAWCNIIWLAEKEGKHLKRVTFRGPRLGQDMLLSILVMWIGAVLKALITWLGNSTPLEALL